VGYDHGEPIQQLFHCFGKLRRGLNPDPFFASDDEQYRSSYRQIMALAQQYPWLPSGFVDLDRLYDYVIYMLEVWTEDDREDALARSAILGSQKIGAEITSSQGFPIHYSTSEQSAVIYKYLQDMEQRASLPHLDFERVPEDRYLYKRRPAEFFADPEQKKEFNARIKNTFRPLLNFYKGVRQNGFGVISLRD
jgi:hypothetical protein